MTAPPTSNSLVFGTYNSRGYAPDRVNYVKHLLSLCHVLFIQEHWLFEADLARLCNNLTNVSYVGVSGMNQNELILGRPYGGTAILYRNGMNCRVKSIECNNSRICACIITWPNGITLLFVNVYLPYEKPHDRLSLIEFRDVIEDVIRIIDANDDIDHIVFGGDLNSDLTRTMSRHIDPLRDLCQRTSLSFCVEHQVNSVDFTYRSDATGAISTLDHFLVTENLCGVVQSFMMLSTFPTTPRCY